MVSDLDTMLAKMRDDLLSQGLSALDFERIRGVIIDPRQAFANLSITSIEIGIVEAGPRVAREANVIIDVEGGPEHRARIALPTANLEAVDQTVVKSRMLRDAIGKALDVLDDEGAREPYADASSILRAALAECA